MHDYQDQKWKVWAEAPEDDKPTKFFWTPSKIIHKLGLEIKNADSVLYWAAKNDIPIFSPALTDGSLGDVLYFHARCFHAATRNYSTETKQSVVFTFRSLDNPPVPGTKSAQWPELLLS